MIIGHLEVSELSSSFSVVKNKRNNKYVKLGLKELRFLFETLSVKREQIEPQLARCFLSAKLNHDEEEFLLGKFVEWGFVGVQDDIDKNKKNCEKKDWSKIKILQINPEKLLKKIPFFFTYLFSGIGLIGILIFSLLKYFIVVFDLRNICEEIISIKFSAFNIIICIFLMEISVIFHEFGHALACMHYGGKVSSMGVVLFFLFPALYCDVSDVYMLKDRKHSICISLAGICANILFGSIIFGIYCFLSYFFNVQLGILLLFWIGNLFAALFNLIPFVKLDGYWLVASLLGITNLMEKAVTLFIATIFDRNDIPKNLSIAKKGLMFVYGGIALIFRPLFWAYSLYNIVLMIEQVQINSLITILISVVLLIIAFLIEFRFCKEQILKYKADHKRILKLIQLS